MNTITYPSPAVSPRERGECDAYYGRLCSPHYYGEGGKRITHESMTPDQIAEYKAGFEEWVDLGLLHDP